MKNGQNLKITIILDSTTPSMPLDLAKRILQTFYHYCLTSPMLAGLLMALPIACNTSESFSFTLYHLQLAIFPFVPSYRLQQYLFVCKRLLIGMSPYPPSRIGY
jgi:hypothetical protein